MKIITDRDTDIVFFSKYLCKFGIWRHIHKTLLELKVKHAILPFTKDLWMRDYMPIQITEDRLIQYAYNPDYLQNDKKFITDPSLCCEFIHQTPIKTNIILDGGNVIKCSNAIIMTDKIFKENPDYKRIELINELENLFQMEIILIPWDKEERFGHADGMVRCVSDNMILINNYYNFDKPFRRELLKALAPRFEIQELHYDVKHLSEYSWAYINFLMVGNIILIPELGVEEDLQAYSQLEEIYHARLMQINVSDLVIQGGALNCISWNIKVNENILLFYDENTKYTF